MWETPMTHYMLILVLCVGCLPSTLLAGGLPCCYDIVYETKQITCYRPVCETHFRDVAFTVSRPVYHTEMREERCTVNRLHTDYVTRQVNCTFVKPVYEIVTQ